MALKKKNVQPTFEERLNGAQAQASAALSVFAGITADLQNSAVEKKAVAADAHAEIDRLEELILSLEKLAYDAEESAEADLAKAASINALVGN